jgi:hypothetical protein
MSLGQLILDSLQFAGMFILARDLLRLDARVEQTEAGNVREDAAERVLHDEGTQLRAELDGLHAAVKMLAQADRIRDGGTSWDDSKQGTLEYYGGPQTLKSGETQMKSNEPPLPSWFEPEPHRGDE